MVLVNCQFCGKEFLKAACWIKRNPTNFCSVDCHNKWQEANSVKINKRCKICNKEFKVRPCYVKRFSTCSHECSVKAKSKENNPNWRGGYVKERQSEITCPSYKKWRALVLKRDDYTCQHCGAEGCIFAAHHIKPWAFFKELRFDVDNGITLCIPCHKKTYKEAFELRNMNQFDEPQSHRLRWVRLAKEIIQFSLKHLKLLYNSKGMLLLPVLH